MNQKPNMFSRNQPEKEMVCTDPTGKKYELHEYVKGFSFHCCKNCGVDSPQ